MSHGQTPETRPSNAIIALTVLGIVLAGPGLALALWSFGFAFAPPWTSFTGLIYPLLACLGVPLGIIAVLMRKIRLVGFLITLGSSGLLIILVLTVLGSQARIPTGMTACQPLAALPSRARYSCLSTSSDDADHRYEFILEGRAGWPVMRLIDTQ